MSSFLKHSVPLYSIAISAMFAGAAVWIIKDRAEKSHEQSNAVPEINAVTKQASCPPTFGRVSGYNYISPLLYVETQCESEELADVRNLLLNTIEQEKMTGNLKEASFYFRDLDKTKWTGYKQDDKYFPGSLMKVPDLISYLLMEEQNPGVLNTKLFYDKPFISQKSPVFISQKLPERKYYSVKELLRYMIANSDNNATVLLSNSFEDKYFKKVLSDFHLPPVEANQKNYPISAREFSWFIRSLYNASYLSQSHSEFAAELLGTSDFKDGFIKGLPAGTKLIHKFGEAGDNETKQLHESGILYVKGHAYLFTVMTKGNDLHQLADVLSKMAATLYKYLNENN